VKILVLHQI